ncbi:hypothetical protein [Neisseria dentiae]|uniref:hypothetical protein n=1 Tax=Neisseria dentiae TaxID=194197 RepID=UPI0035A0FF27
MSALAALLRLELHPLFLEVAKVSACLKLSVIFHGLSDRHLPQHGSGIDARQNPNSSTNRIQASGLLD